jgi:hypothetical protein
MQVPAFLLRRLYVKGSLRALDGGFAFDLQNSLGAGYAEEMLPLTIDGEELSLDAVSFRVDGETLTFRQVGPGQPFTLAMDKLVTIAAFGRTLTDGAHKIGLGFVVTGMGTMQFEVTDAVAGAAGADADYT